jgi:hypothetical protein
MDDSRVVVERSDTTGVEERDTTSVKVEIGRTSGVGNPLLAVMLAVSMFRHCPNPELIRSHSMAPFVPKCSTHPDAEATIVRETEIHSIHKQ